MYRKHLKRLFDLTTSLLLFFVLFPLYIILYILIYFKLGSPCIFKQKRPGYNNKVFTIYKFRTMLNTYDSNGRLLSDEKRLTSFGKLLRRMSLDELPELFNVIKGDMSMVGPRPLLIEYLPHYSKEQSRRHNVKPGITGLAQIRGRNALSWEDRFKLDIWYVDHISFCLDLKIILMTFAIVFKSKGITAKGHATMPRFNDKK